jgi:hypothetical protein
LLCRIKTFENPNTTVEVKVKEKWKMGRTKLGNANAQRNNNKKLGNRTSEELVEFTTGQENDRQPDLKDKKYNK